MDIPRPDEGDVNIGTNIVKVCWALTGFVGIVLIFRCAMKAWVRWTLPQVSMPGRIWGFEDIFFLLGFAVDILHMVLIQYSYDWGLGRHFFYLSPEEKVQALKYDYASQPCAVAAAMISRTGMMWFLFSCFANSNRRLRISIIICMIIQIVVNSITIVQITVQCGPNPYRTADRTRYFHYMWDAFPSDGSVVCQSPKVQTTVGYVQGGFNTVIDLYLAGISAYELWQFFLQTLQRNPDVSIWAQFIKINPNVRSRRIWQTLTLSGPLVLSGVASIVKTYLLQYLGDRADFTYNIVPFILWVKIENYGILIATCAPVIRLFLRTFVDMRREGRSAGYPWSRSHTDNRHNDGENDSGENSSGSNELAMKRRDNFHTPRVNRKPNSSKTNINVNHNHNHSSFDPDKTFDSILDDNFPLTTVVDKDDDDNNSGSNRSDASVHQVVTDPSSNTTDYHHHNQQQHPYHNNTTVTQIPPAKNKPRNSSNMTKSKNQSTRHSAGVGVTVKTDIVVEVGNESDIAAVGGGRSSLMPVQNRNESTYPSFTPQDDRNRIERHASAYAWKLSD